MAQMPAIDPMHQFLIHKVVDLPPVNIGGFMLDLSITNSILMLLIGAGALMVFLAFTAQGKVVPNRAQASAEALYGIIDNVLVSPIIGPGGKPYIPFIFTIFMLILTLNLMSVVLAVGNLGGFEWTFTVTAQLAVTATLALITFLSIFLLGFVKHGPKFLSLFWVPGMGVIGGALMVIIEMISYFVRPITLALRLFGNMLGGHVVMSLFGSFVIGLAIFALGGGLSSLGWIGSGLSLTMIVALTGLELVVAVLQAFVFAALATVYLNEVVNFGHGH
jgi:F-type H+-transporting ATPase subunit a